MCNETAYSESGAPIAPTRCAEYITLKEENARLLAQLSDFHTAVQHVTEDGKTTRSYSTSDGWAMVHAGRLSDLEVAEERENVLMEQSSEDATVICRLKRIIAQQRAVLNEWIDIAESQSIYDEFNKRYTHSFMSAGEHMWKLLGLTDPYVPQEEFYVAVKRYKDSINVFSEVHND